MIVAGIVSAGSVAAAFIQSRGRTGFRREMRSSLASLDQQISNVDHRIEKHEELHKMEDLITRKQQEER